MRGYERGRLGVRHGQRELLWQAPTSEKFISLLDFE